MGYTYQMASEYTNLAGVSVALVGMGQLIAAIFANLIGGLIFFTIGAKGP
jgi:fructose-1,6-bisphosphatase/inositol monophosphatase family enzyme